MLYHKKRSQKIWKKIMQNSIQTSVIILKNNGQNSIDIKFFNKAAAEQKYLLNEERIKNWIEKIKVKELDEINDSETISLLSEINNMKKYIKERE